MHSRLPVLLFRIFPIHAPFAQEIQPIGIWREHLPYRSAVKVVNAGTVLFCATPYSLFSLDPTTMDVRRFSKVSGLSERGINTINFDDLSKKLFIPEKKLLGLSGNSVLRFDGSTWSTHTGKDFFNKIRLAYFKFNVRLFRTVMSISPSFFKKNSWLAKYK